ncbi:MAG: RDD family protein [Solirubrobacterales bacterium]
MADGEHQTRRTSEDLDRNLGERIVGTGARGARRLGHVAGVDAAVEAMVEEAIVAAIGSPAVERALVRVAEEGKLEESIERALATAEVEEAIKRAIDSEIADRVWADMLASDKAQLLVDRVANAPEVRNAITAQGFGLVTDIGRQVSKITERFDDLLERIACRIIRKPERDAETNQAGFATRVVARVIDGALLFGVLSVASGLLASVVPVAFGETGGLSIWALLGLFLLGFSLVGTYLVTFWSLIGQTPGMRFLGIRLQHKGSDEIGLRVAFGRLLALLLSLAPAGLGFFYLLISPKRRALHDHLANTEVIYDEASAPWSLEPREWAGGDERSSGDGSEPAGELPPGARRAADDMEAARGKETA